MEIVAFNEDDRADGNGKAGITWISKDLLSTKHSMNSTGTTEGGWSSSNMRSYLKNTVKPLIPATVRNAIVEVSKISSTYENGAIVKDGQTTTDDVWIPSVHEVANTINTYETIGSTYYTKFADNNSRKKEYKGSAIYWWMRSSYSGISFKPITDTGEVYFSGQVATTPNGVALGFCTN